MLVFDAAPLPWSGNRVAGCYHLRVYHPGGRQAADADRLVLASASPRRAALLAGAGHAFEVAPAGIDERRLRGEPPRDYVLRLAVAKAAAVAGRYPGRIVIGADTTVVLGAAVLGKPRDAGEAAGMLERLSGRSHEVLTGVAARRDGRSVAAVEATVVHFAPLDARRIACYVGTGEPLDKAGAYGLQGAGGQFVTRIEGSRSNVVGLPLAVLKRLLAELGSCAALTAQSRGRYP